jgi:hypothetical protein
VTCERCAERPAKSPALRLCEVCLYAEQLGAEKAAEQLAAAAAAKARRRTTRAKVKR